MGLAFFIRLQINYEEFKMDGMFEIVGCLTVLKCVLYHPVLV
jgi:hypothetical protein